MHACAPNWKIIICSFSSAPVMVGGSTALETPVQVSKTHCELGIVNKQHGGGGDLVEGGNVDVHTCSHQCQAAGASGPSGLRAPGPAERSRCPATGAAAVLSPRLEEQPAQEKKKYTTGSECRSRDSPAPLSPSARVRSHACVYAGGALFFLIYRSSSSLPQFSTNTVTLPSSLPPVHGSWSPWSTWSDCDGCAGSSTRTRECNSPPTRFGGLPCLGESRQRRSCHDNITVCSGQLNK